jgi:hypothetical protein
MFIWISGGGRRWRIIGKSGAWPKIFGWKLGAWPKIFGWKLGAWPKIFGWKYDKPMENIWFEIRKILDIDGIINFGDGHNIATFIHSLCYFYRFLQKCPNLHWRRRLLKHKILDF